MAEVVDHYNASAPTYTEQYDETMIHTATEYPANYFRLKKIKDRINELGIKSVYELGIGDGSPITAMARMGLRVGGSDFSEGMLKVAKQQFVDNGFDPDLLTFGNLDRREATIKAQHGSRVHAALGVGGLVLIVGIHQERHQGSREPRGWLDDIGSPALVQ